ncbi:MAG: cyclopropane-fatty-acyl-phospholipid synthase family protein, partial [Burkholderiaceae bacterium]
MFLQKRLGMRVKAIQASSNLPLRLQLWNGQQYDFGQQAPQVTVKIAHASALRSLLNPSLLNLGQAYVEGKFDIEGPLDAIIDIANKLSVNALIPGKKLRLLLNAFSHTRDKDAAAIQYHYDVSNAFYQAFLDPLMVYSCAYFEQGDEDLQTAQLKKIDHILTKIAVKQNELLLDIGCGWGALVIRAAQKFGARCVGITLSENQYALARERVEQAGLSDRIDIRLQDYRDVSGQFDRITSVG